MTIDIRVDTITGQIIGAKPDSAAFAINPDESANVIPLSTAINTGLAAGYGHVSGDALDPQTVAQSVAPTAPGYVFKLLESGKAAVSILSNMVEAEVEQGNRNNIPEEIRTWYLLTLCAALSEMEHHGAPEPVRLGQAMKIQDAITHFDRRKGEMEMSVVIFARDELMHREICPCIADRTYGGRIPG